MEERYVKLIISGVLVVIWLVLTRALVAVTGARSVDELQRRRIRRIVKTTTTFVLTGLLVLTWAKELRGVALALGAFSVALVVGTKELILNFLGWVVKVSNHTHHIGDRVKVAGVYGEVIDAKLLGSVVKELDPETGRPTGRTISMPHSLLLTNAVQKESAETGAVVWDEFRVTVKNAADLARLEPALRAITEEMATPEKADVHHLPGEEPPLSVFVDARDDKAWLAIRYRIPFQRRQECRDRLGRTVLELTGAPPPAPAAPEPA